jgi:hypothetical protein
MRELRERGENSGGELVVLVTLAVTMGGDGRAGVQQLWERLGVLSGALGGREKGCGVEWRVCRGGGFL